MSSQASPSSPEGVSTNVYLGVGGMLNVLAILLVMIRCATNYLLNKLGADDFLSIFGLICSTGTFIINAYINSLLLDPTTSLSLLIKMVVVIAVFVAFTLWTTKAPILVLYVRLFGVRKLVRWVSWVTLVVTALNFIGTFILPVAQCETRTTVVDPSLFLTCQNATVTGGIWGGFVSIIEDVIIFCLPIPAILQLNLPLSKKIGVALVFFTGIIAIVASAVSLAFKWQSMAGSSVGVQTAAMLCATIEANTALMVGCAPAAKAFWVTYISRTSAAAKTQSSSAPRSGYWPGSKLSRSGLRSVGPAHSTHSTNQIYNPNNTNASYILMETPQGSQTDLEGGKPPHAL